MSAATTQIVPLRDTAVPPREWDALAAAAAEPNPFAERWFLGAAARHLDLPDDARLIVVRDADGLIGLLPIAAEAIYGRLRVRHVENWRHVNCFFGTPLVRAGCEAAFWAHALTALDRNDDAPNFLHLAALAADGPVTAALLSSRAGAAIVHHGARALLASPLTPAAYYEANVRKKKRKEIGRLRARLAELGTIDYRQLTDRAELSAWIEAFLALEASGWKGREGGAALSNNRGTAAFTRAALTGAWDAGRLEVRRLDLDGNAIAMLVNFMVPPGSFSFKIAFDEAYARFSPGVLISIDNLAVLGRSDIAWMDSCAVPGHPMIEGLWAERRTLVRVTVPLAGLGRRATFAAARTLENAAALVRSWR